MILNDIQQRVLGVLMEKSLTQPDSYPLTLNSILLGANQKQNREPVLELNEREISEALRGLELKQLVSQAPPAIGARAVRFRHHVVERFQWDRREQAVMAELLLRGLQTPGELRTHASRMTPFGELDAVVMTLNGLRNRESPFVEELAREPGRSANRFRHLLSAAGPPKSQDAGTVQVPAEMSGTSEAAGTEEPTLAQRVARLEESLARLEARLAEKGL